MTWNIEGLKQHQFVLADVLLSHLPDIVFLSEPLVFQTDIQSCLNTVQHEYCHSLNSSDLYDRDLPILKSRAIGGTLALWRRQLDPYISVYPVDTPAFLPLIVELPGAQTSVHIALYLPTSGKEYEYVSELASLKNCLYNLKEKYCNPPIYVRGDGNSNPKNVARHNLLASFREEFFLKLVEINHPTYHHFMGGGKYDSNIDIILFSDPGHECDQDKNPCHDCSQGEHHGCHRNQVHESVIQIVCKLDCPEILSHHHMIISQLTLPPACPKQVSTDLVRAPRTERPRYRTHWDEAGIV